MKKLSFVLRFVFLNGFCLTLIVFFQNCTNIRLDKINVSSEEEIEEIEEIEEKEEVVEESPCGYDACFEKVLTSYYKMGWGGNLAYSFHPQAHGYKNSSQSGFVLLSSMIDFYGNDSLFNLPLSGSAISHKLCSESGACGNWAFTNGSNVPYSVGHETSYFVEGGHVETFNLSDETYFIAGSNGMTYHSGEYNAHNSVTTFLPTLYKVNKNSTVNKSVYVSSLYSRPFFECLSSSSKFCISDKPHVVSFAVYEDYLVTLTVIPSTKLKTNQVFRISSAGFSKLAEFNTGIILPIRGLKDQFIGEVIDSNGKVHTNTYKFSNGNIYLVQENIVPFNITKTNTFSGKTIAGHVKVSTDKMYILYKTPKNLFVLKHSVDGVVTEKVIDHNYNIFDMSIESFGNNSKQLLHYKSTQKGHQVFLNNTKLTMEAFPEVGVIEGSEKRCIVGVEVDYLDMAYNMDSCISWPYNGTGNSESLFLGPDKTILVQLNHGNQPLIVLYKIYK